MRPSVNRWRRWSERPLLFVPDPQEPARQSRCTKICRMLRRKMDVGEGCAPAANEAGAVCRVRCKTQSRSFSIITADVTSRHGVEGDTILNRNCSAWSTTEPTQTPLPKLRLGQFDLAISQFFLQLSGGVAVVIRSHIAERGIAYSSGAAASFLEGTMDSCRRLADDASRVAEDGLAESSGWSDLFVVHATCTMSNSSRNTDYFMTS